MPYCSGCGSRYQEGDTVCKSCGFELVYDVDPKSAGKNPAGAGKEKNLAGGEGKSARSRRRRKSDNTGKLVLSGPNRGAEPAEAPQDQANAAVPAPLSQSRCLQAEVISNLAAYNDIHLGKGIIKPKWVEVGIDGFHFKYEEPPFSMRKTEPAVNEARAEYQSSNQDSNWFSFSEPSASDGSGGGMEAGAERNGFAGVSVPAVCEDSGDSRKGLAELNAEARLTPVEPVAEEPSRRTEDPVPVAVDSPENAAVILAPENPDFPPERETPAPGELNGEPVWKSSGVGPDQTFGHRDESGDITTVKDEAEAESAPRLSSRDAPVGNGPAELKPESGAGIEPGDRTPRETDSPEDPEEENNTVLWRGQQSWFGIPFPCFYQLTQRSLMVVDSNGRTIALAVSAISRVTLRQSWFAKVLGIGDLILEFNDPARLRQILPGIANPNKAKSVLEELIASGV